ncbi:Transcriptional repressor tup1-like protein, partial [Globisporangium splendens]
MHAPTAISLQRRVHAAPPLIGATSNLASASQTDSTSTASNTVSSMISRVKAEYEAVLQELAMSKMEQSKMEHKIQSQVMEMNQIQQALGTLEANYRHTRQKYEEDLARMQRQLDKESATAAGLPKNKRPRTQTADLPSLPDPAIQAPSAVAISALSAPLSRMSTSPASATPVQPASRSLQQLGHQTSSLSRVTNENTKESVQVRRLPSVPQPGVSSPTSKKPKPNGSIGHDDRSSPTSPSSGANPAASNKPISPTANRDTERHSSGEPNTSSYSKNMSAPNSGAPEAKSTVRNASTKASRLKWKSVYPSTRSPSPYQEAERPVAEMHHSIDHAGVVCIVRFSDDGAMIGSGSHKAAQAFDVATGDQKFFAACPGSTSVDDAEDEYIRALCFSPDCSKLVVGMPDSTIRIWDIASKEEGLALTGHKSKAYSLDCVSNFIASGSGDRTVRIWDARSGRCTQIFGSEQGGPSDGVTSVVFSPDGRLLAAGSLDKGIRIWDTETTQLLARLDGHSDSVYSIAFSRDGKSLLSGSFDSNVMLWDVNAHGQTATRPCMVFQGHKDFVLAVAHSPDGRYFMSGSKDRSVVFWDPRSSRSVLTLAGYRNSVISVASSPASPYFATGSGDCFTAVWKYTHQTI